MRAAAVVAERCGAALRIVHVVEPLDAFQRLSHPLTSPYTLEDIVQKVGARLQALAKSPEFDHLHSDYEVRTGKPFVELITAAKACLADLIVVGGTSGSEELLGGTSERILRKTPIPVIVAKKPLSREAKTFLIPTDFSSCSRRPLRRRSCLVSALMPAWFSFMFWTRVAHWRLDTLMSWA